MDHMAIAFPFNDPVAIHLGSLSVRWYGLSYMAGLLLGWIYMRRLCEHTRVWGGHSPMRAEQADDYLFWATIGTVLGGRIGFFLFYEPSSILCNFITQPGIERCSPWTFFRVWEGGMAFHGGLLGVGLAIWLFARRNAIPVRALMDLNAAVIPFGLFFGRIANFINAEIYGALTNVPWAVQFPADKISKVDRYACAVQNISDCATRHPTQLYEAALEGVVMFVLIRYLTHKRHAFLSPGLATGTFLAAYGLFRIFAEYFKEWDRGQFFTTAYFSEGVVYSLPMIALGVYFMVTSRARSTTLNYGASGASRA